MNSAMISLRSATLRKMLNYKYNEKVLIKINFNWKIDSEHLLFIKAKINSDIINGHSQRKTHSPHRMFRQAQESKSRKWNEKQCVFKFGKSAHKWSRIEISQNEFNVRARATSSLCRYGYGTGLSLVE